MSSLSVFVKRCIKVTGRLGYTARGLVYCLVGCFFVIAALLSNPSEAGGLQKALEILMEQPFGPYLIAGVGVGVIMFGRYCELEARYRKVDEESEVNGRSTLLRQCYSRYKKALKRALS